MTAPLWKNPKGTYERERRERRLDAEAHEKREKAKVRARDMKCRWPGCDCTRLKLRTEVAHVLDKSLGGSSDAGNMILLCVSKHQGRPSLHSGDLEVRPQTPAGTNGPCDFLELRGSTWFLVAGEVVRGVSSVRRSA